MSQPELAVVVGAAGDIGSVIVDRLIATGLDVLGVGRDSARLDGLARRHGAAFEACRADIADDAAEPVIGARVRGRVVAALVHAPGVPVAGGVAAVSPQSLVAACNIKVGGFLRAVRAVLPAARAGTRLIAIGGHYGFEPTAYAATAGVANAALANLVRQMSWAYGSQGLTAHLLAPGPADTARLHAVLAHRAQAEGTTIDDELDRLRADSAVGALTEPDEIAWAVTLLLAPEARALAGSTLFLDAGRRRGLP